MRESERLIICETLLNAYKDEISAEDMYCAKQLEKEWTQSKPFAGKNILFNGHITLSTLITLRLLLIGGANLDVSATDSLVIHSPIAKIIDDAGLDFYRANKKIPKNKKDKFYDIVFDCGAELLNKVTPKIGMVELTQTDKKLYDKISFPVISVDISETKKVETGMGTGEGLTRVILDRLTNTLLGGLSYYLNANKPEPILLLMFAIKSIVVNTFKDKKFVIFGGGKVGTGIREALIRAGTDPKNLTIVDISPDTCEEIKKRGCNALLLSENDKDSIGKIKESFKDAFSLITATGVESVVSKHFELEDIKHIPILINMGTFNEYDKTGKKIPTERIFNNGKPANFALERPTPIRYLDAVFTLLAKAGEELKNAKLPSGLNPVSKELDNEILSKWQKFNDKRESEFEMDKRKVMKQIDDKKVGLLLSHTTFFKSEPPKHHKNPNPSSSKIGIEKPKKIQLIGVTQNGIKEISFNFDSDDNYLLSANNKIMIEQNLNAEPKVKAQGYNICGFRIPVPW